MKQTDEVAECSYDSGSPTSVSKQRKITESAMPVLDAPPEYTSAFVSASEPAIAGSCKQEVMGPEVSYDMDFAGFDDDPSDFLDIWRTINGCEFTSEFQKYLNESERDSSNLNFNSGELTCLSVSDVNDAVAEKLPTAQQSSTDSEPSMQNAAFVCQSFQPLYGDTKYVNPPFSASTMPVDSHSVQPWHQSGQVHEPVMHHLQLLLTSQQPDSCSELLKYYQIMQMKPRPGAKMQLQSHDTQSLSRTQGIQPRQQPPRSQLQSCYPRDVPAEHLQQYVMTSEHQTWSQPEWQMSAHCMQPMPQQPYPYQFVSASAGMCSHSVKKEMSLASSAAGALTRPSPQLSSACSESDSQVLPPQYSNTTVAAPTCHSQSTINWPLNW